ncbi:hypothetical protein BpHYR1_030460 [Brachionus plicatilis]|uniref:CCHC-type domain-containing protein n=1 Tax=Brachionus plicatilis TaxID=10195 RepID=A0A3M7QC10_BRAPC|nr:hypothetical protein BpHYR1_030460 [Brachionus plicatilis]
MGLWDILKAITHQEQESGITKRIIKFIETSIAQITPCMNRCWCLINDNVLMSTFVAIITIIIMIMWTTILSYKRQKNNNFTFVCNNQKNNATSQLPTALPVLNGTTAVSAAPTLSNRTLTHQRVDQNVTDTFIADQFIDGIKSTEIQIKLKVARPTLNSLSEITELASRYEEVLNTTPRTSMHARKTNTESNYPIQDQPRNISPDSRHVSFEPTQRCYRCNQTGHIRPNCPQIRPKYDPIPPRALINNLNAPNHQ